MSQKLKVTKASKQAALSIDFIVIGAGVSGLASAIALQRVGHRVLVIEKYPNFDKEYGPYRMPPNFSKILFNWGLEDEVRSFAAKSEEINIYIQDTGEFIGKHVWADEVLQETGGDFLFGQMGDLRRFLHQVALSCGAKFRLGTRVVSVDTLNTTVTLDSGEILKADVIVGADGTTGISRQKLMEENDQFIDPAESQLNMYSAIVPQSCMLQQSELKDMVEREHTTLFTWFGNAYAALAFKLGGPSHNFGMYIYGPKDGNEDGWENDASKNIAGLQNLLQSCESRLRSLGKLARWAVCIPVQEDVPLEEWISGRLVAVGASVHPIPSGSIQDCAMSFEDGVVLAKLFSHLRTKDQIDSFLGAYQELRQPRINTVHGREVGIVHYMTMPPCDFQQARDNGMRTKRDAGVNVLDADGDLEESPEWVEIKEIFAYDCEDAADDWWQGWGKWAPSGAIADVSTEFTFQISSTASASVIEGD